MSANPEGVKRLAFALLNGTAETKRSTLWHNAENFSYEPHDDETIAVEVHWFHRREPFPEDLQKERKVLMERLKELDAMLFIDHGETLIQLDQEKGAPKGATKGNAA